MEEQRSAAIREIAKNIISEVEKVIVGKHSEILLLLTAMISGGHVLLEDVPGVGKTTLASAIAKSAGLKFRRAQFTPDVMASDIVGFNIYNRSNDKFEFREGLVMCNILLADEINRASPKTQSSLLEAMEEHRVTVDGVTYELPSPFTVIATQNPAGYVGTYPLPEAQLDRFALRLSLGYTSEREEIEIISSRKRENPIASIETAASAADISEICAAVENVEIAPEICEYIVKLIQATRKSPLLALGASPRASLSLMKSARALAFLKGRDYVISEDVAVLFAPAIAHRLVLSQEARLNRESAESVLSQILKEIPAPLRSAR